MKIKFEYVALVIIIIALIAYIALKSPDKTHYELPRLETVKDGEITRVKLERPDTTEFSLVKSGGGWKIMPQEYEADDSGVERLLKELSGFNITTLVSESKTYSRYGLAAGEKIGVTVYGGDEIVRDFDLGKTASTQRHTYVRLHGDSKVYEAQNNLRNIFDKSIDDLRDKNVFSFENTAVTGLAIISGTDSVRFDKTSVPAPVTAEEGEEDKPSPVPEVTWKNAAGEKARPESIKSLLNSLNNLKCKGFIEGKTKADFSDPVFSITVIENENRSVAIFEKTEDGDYPAISSESEFPFLLNDWKAKQIMKKPDDLLVE